MCMDSGSSMDVAWRRVAPVRCVVSLARFGRGSLRSGRLPVEMSLRHSRDPHCEAMSVASPSVLRWHRLRG